MSSNNILKDDETFLKEFLKSFYHHIVNIDNYENFEIILKEWVKDYFNINEKNFEIILKSMEDHEENENWFSSLIGFFYEFDKVFNIIDKNESFKLYSLPIYKYENDENKKLISIYQLLNIIIAKYLLSFHYYKDILCNKRNLIVKRFKYLENTNVMSHNQFENFNGLEINLCKDEINSMEKYFESIDKCSKDYDDKKKELMKLNNLGYCYQHGIEKKKDEFKAFEFYLKSAKGGNLSAQNNLGYCYQNGIGVTKNEKEAFEWYLKAANEGDLQAQYNLGICYQNGIGVNKDNKKAFEWYFKSAKDYLPAQNILGNCYQNEIGIEKDLEKAIYWYKKAAANGNKFAQCNLGNCYKNGIGIKKDERKAISLYQKSAEQEYSMAQFELGCCYNEGIGTKINKKKHLNYMKLLLKKNIVHHSVILEFYMKMAKVQKRI
jgi:TPR repeat protein